MDSTPALVWLWPLARTIHEGASDGRSGEFSGDSEPAGAPERQGRDQSDDRWLSQPGIGIRRTHFSRTMAILGEMIAPGGQVVRGRATTSHSALNAKCRGRLKTMRRADEVTRAASLINSMRRRETVARESWAAHRRIS